MTDFRFCIPAPVSKYSCITAERLLPTFNQNLQRDLLCIKCKEVDSWQVVVKFIESTFLSHLIWLVKNSSCE